MFARLAQQYRAVVDDLVLSLQALARCLQERGWVASCYVCGDGANQSGVSFVADLGDSHVVRFLVSAYGISWVESRNGMELLKLEGADAIHELHRVALQLQAEAPESEAPQTGAAQTGVAQAEASEIKAPQIEPEPLSPTR